MEQASAQDPTTLDLATLCSLRLGDLASACFPLRRNRLAVPERELTLAKAPGRKQDHARASPVIALTLTALSFSAALQATRRR